MKVLNSQDGYDMFPNHCRTRGFVGVYIGQTQPELNHGDLVVMETESIDDMYDIAMWQTLRGDVIALPANLVVPSLQSFRTRKNGLHNVPENTPVRVLHKELFILPGATSDALDDEYAIMISSPNAAQIKVRYRTRGGRFKEIWARRNAFEFAFNAIDWARYFRQPRGSLVQIIKQTPQFLKGEIVEVCGVRHHAPTGNLRMLCRPAHNYGASLSVVVADVYKTLESDVDDSWKHANGFTVGELVRFDRKKHAFIKRFRRVNSGREQMLIADLEVIDENGESPVTCVAARGVGGLQKADAATVNTVLSERQPNETVSPVVASRYASLVDIYALAQTWQQQLSVSSEILAEDTTITLTANSAVCSDDVSIAVDFSNPHKPTKENTMLELKTVHYIQNVDLNALTPEKVNELLCKEAQRIKDLEDAPIKTKAYRKSVADQRKNLDRIIEFIDAQTAPSDDE